MKVTSEKRNSLLDSENKEVGVFALSSEKPKEKTPKEMGIPVKETVLATPIAEYQGILVQETLPPFSIYTKENLRIDVSGIPMSELVEANKKTIESFLSEKLGKTEKGKDYIWGVFEKYIQSVPNCPKDVSFAKFALKRFMSEYCDLRNGNLDMSAMVRSAMKDGIHFEFYEKSAKNNISEDLIGCYNDKTKSVKFNCKNYVLDKRSVIHNTLAHELCHYSMDDTEGGYACTFLKSDLGSLWYEIMKSESFLGVEGWKKTYQQYADKNKKALYGNHSFFRNLRGEYKKSLFYEAQYAKKGEIFARVMGLFAKQKGGLDFIKKQDTKRLGLQVVCDMAMAHADGNDRKYQAIIDNLSKHKIAPETMQAILNLKSCQEDILEKGDFSERDYKLFMFHSNEATKQIKKEFKTFEEKVVDHNVVSDEQEKGVSEHATTLYDRLAKSSDLTVNHRLSLRKKQVQQIPYKTNLPKYPLMRVKTENKIVSKWAKRVIDEK